MMKKKIYVLNVCKIQHFITINVVKLKLDIAALVYYDPKC